jgi:hypothetical protein
MRRVTVTVGFFRGARGGEERRGAVANIMPGWGTESILLAPRLGAYRLIATTLPFVRVRTRTAKYSKEREKRPFGRFASVSEFPVRF